jgi:hypothetical protein
MEKKRVRGSWEKLAKKSISHLVKRILSDKVKSEKLKVKRGTPLHGDI